MNSGFSLLDVGIIALYFMYIAWRGYKLSFRSNTADDFFLASRSLTWPVIGLSLYASNMSSSTLIGLASSGYKTGISVFNYEWVGTLVLIAFALFFLPMYLRSKLYTMPEFLEKRFDSRSRTYFSGLTVIANIGIDTAATLYAGSLVLSLVFPDYGINTFIFLLALISALYTMTGGLRAVVQTDVIQSILLTIGSIIITVALFNKIGGWEAILSFTPEENLSLIRPASDDFLPWPALIISLPILGFYFWCTNQHIVQRVLGAGSVEDGQKGALLAGFLKLPLLFIMVLPGVMAVGLYPNLEQPNLVYPHLK
jgi:SSS family solute:Na+ symporter